MRLLRAYIRALIAENAKEDKRKHKTDKLLTEPDETAGRENGDEHHDEASAISTGAGSMQSAGTIQGVTTPLGTGPAHPKKSKKKKKKSPGEAYASSFARASAVKNI